MKCGLMLAPKDLFALASTFDRETQQHVYVHMCKNECHLLNNIHILA